MPMLLMLVLNKLEPGIHPHILHSCIEQKIGWGCKVHIEHMWRIQNYMLKL